MSRSIRWTRSSASPALRTRRLMTFSASASDRSERTDGVGGGALGGDVDDVAGVALRIVYSPYATSAAAPAPATNPVRPWKPGPARRYQSRTAAPPRAIHVSV